MQNETIEQKKYRVGVVGATRSAETLGDELGCTYATLDEATNAALDIDWDSEWGPEPELCVEESMHDSDFGVTVTHDIA